MTNKYHCKCLNCFFDWTSDERSNCKACKSDDVLLIESAKKQMNEPPLFCPSLFFPPSDKKNDLLHKDSGFTITWFGEDKKWKLGQ